MVYHKIDGVTNENESLCNCGIRQSLLGRRLWRGFGGDGVDDHGLVGYPRKSGDGEELLAEPEVAEFATGLVHCLDTRDDLNGTAVRALAGDAVRAVDLESGGILFLAVHGYLDGYAIGGYVEDNRFDGNITPGLACEFEMGFEEEVAKRPEFLRMGCRTKAGNECAQRDGFHSPISHNESVVLPEGS